MAPVIMWMSADEKLKWNIEWIFTCRNGVCVCVSFLFYLRAVFDIFLQTFISILYISIARRASFN